MQNKIPWRRAKSFSKTAMSKKGVSLAKKVFGAAHLE
jgi:hypothetical protein